MILSSAETGQFVKDCGERADTDLAADFCLGYVMGTLDALSINHKVCPRDANVVTLQAVAITRKYLREHPEEWGKLPPFLVAEALQQAFPCPTR